MDKQYFTEERLEELKKELEDLKMRRRIEVGERLKRAKELGDLSENSEYFEAREEQAQVETRIAELEDMIKNSEIIEKVHALNVVSIGATLEAEKGGQRRKFTIVGSNEAKPEAGLISNESPLGRAFLGKKAGDTVTVKTPNGTVEYKIVTIE
ncbi:MAG: transcription elongation factor GreA [Candidatus Harrisonbacteria bacterium RIFCSPLOWO2_02_FULL_45_10c]|uniref:Transcription elongation factor GreA n=1 Tax=Candidatus Harrisonbacteria bacterium RIFCSPLOWO2_02_FULL_45_10c TaxID=1798410 RepID=A0A1G1ZU08_9BACT|nr:MAG: transcription elongation factor GreA [Candidatus Harrisonbacteria bacterium RIFCSPLOWO2_02_FULL_45_10c]